MYVFVYIYMYIILPKKKDKIILSKHYYREHGRIYNKL